MRKVYVIGGANLDIQGYSDTNLELHDSLFLWWGW